MSSTKDSFEGYERTELGAVKITHETIKREREKTIEMANELVNEHMERLRAAISKDIEVPTSG